MYKTIYLLIKLLNILKDEAPPIEIKVTTRNTSFLGQNINDSTIEETKASLIDSMKDFNSKGQFGESGN